MLHESCIQGEIPLQSCKLLSISQELGCNQTHFQIAWYAYKSGILITLVGINCKNPINEHTWIERDNTCIL